MRRHPRSAALAGPPFALAAAAIILVSLNLRIPTIAFGPLLPAVLAETGHGETFLSLLTTIPLAITLIVAPLAPLLAERIGRDRAMSVALVGIVAGIGLRSLPGDIALLAGTTLLGCAIAIGTVLAPAAIAAEDSRRRGVLTGLYTMALSLGPALALGLTVPMMRASGFGWRGTLVLWAGCGVLGLVVWQVRSRARTGAVDAEPHAAIARPDSGSAVVPQVPDATVPGVVPPVLRDPGAWLVALYLGITSLTFYTISTWLPFVFTTDGMDAGVAGGFTSLINLVAIPFALLTPIALRRGLGRVVAPASPLPAVIGAILVIMTGSDLAPVVAVLFGVGQGLCLGVSYGQIVEYARSPQHAASVSAVTSAVGVALASIGPLLFGFGLEVSGSAALPLVGLTAVIVVQAMVGMRSGPRRLTDNRRPG